MEEKEIQGQQKSLIDALKKEQPEKNLFLQYLKPYLSNIGIADEYEILNAMLKRTGLNGIESLTHIYTGMTEILISNFPIEATKQCETFTLK